MGSRDGALVHWIPGYWCPGTLVHVKVVVYVPQADARSLELDGIDGPEWVRQVVRDAIASRRAQVAEVDRAVRLPGVSAAEAAEGLTRIAKSRISVEPGRSLSEREQQTAPSQARGAAEGEQPDSHAPMTDRSSRSESDHFKPDPKPPKRK
jgi:hypothetical protein